MNEVVLRQICRATEYSVEAGESEEFAVTSAAQQTYNSYDFEIFATVTE